MRAAHITIKWDGSLESDVKVTIENPCSHTAITTHSTHASLTIQTQIIPRTPPGVMTWIKPVPNIRLPIQPLEGLMETWWLVANFGLVTLVAKPGEHRINKGDPIAHMIFVGSDCHNYEIYHGGNMEDLEGHREFLSKRSGYTNKQLDYMKGIKMDGSKEPLHFTKFKNTCPYHNNSKDL